MIKSMTGFGRSVYGDEKRNITVEVRGVNHRYCDINLKLPRRYGFAEEAVTGIVKEYANRGKIDLYLSVENLSDEELDIKLNLPLARSYYKNLLEIKEEFGLKEEIDLKDISSIPDVIKLIPQVENEEEVIEALSVPVREAMILFDEMRKREGDNIKEDMLKRGELIEKICREMEGKEEILLTHYKERLKERISQLLESTIEVPEERIALEAALFADKSNITEELVRMDSHLSQLKGILEGGEKDSPGKKLDFLVQEMNREANTIGSKANDIGITNSVLQIKSEIEKIREQVQNIE